MLIYLTPSAITTAIPSQSHLLYSSWYIHFLPTRSHHRQHNTLALLVVPRSSLASLELLHVEPADIQVTRVLVHTLREVLDVHRTRPTRLLRTRGVGLVHTAGLGVVVDWLRVLLLLDGCG